MASPAPAQAASETATTSVNLEFYDGQSDKVDGSREEEAVASLICKSLATKLTDSYSGNVVVSGQIAQIMQDLRRHLGKMLGRNQIAPRQVYTRDQHVQEALNKLVETVTKLCEGKPTETAHQFLRQAELASLLVERRATEFQNRIRSMLYGDASRKNDKAKRGEERTPSEWNTVYRIGFQSRHCPLFRGASLGPSQASPRISTIGTASVALQYWNSRSGDASRRGRPAPKWSRELADRLRHLGIREDDLDGLKESNHQTFFSLVGDVLLLTGERRHREYALPSTWAMKRMEEGKSFKIVTEADIKLKVNNQMAAAQQLFGMAFLGIEYESIPTIEYLLGMKNAVTRRDPIFTKEMVKAYKPTNNETVWVNVSTPMRYVQSDGSIARETARRSQVVSVGDVRAWHVRDMSEVAKALSESFTSRQDPIQRLEEVKKHLLSSMKMEQDACRDRPHYDVGGRRHIVAIPTGTTYFF